MLQQILALIIIAFFLARLFWQKQKKQIGANEFVFWLIFWFLAVGAIITLKWIDKLVARLGFTASGIDILIYIAVAIIFYLVFRLRLRLEKMERDITKIVREITLKNSK
jgi:small membrane protein